MSNLLTDTRQRAHKGAPKRALIATTVRNPDHNPLLEAHQDIPKPDAPGAQPTTSGPEHSTKKIPSQGERGERCRTAPQTCQYSHRDCTRGKQNKLRCPHTDTTPDPRPSRTPTSVTPCNPNTPVRGGSRERRGSNRQGRNATCRPLRLHNSVGESPPKERKA